MPPGTTALVAPQGGAVALADDVLIVSDSDAAGVTAGRGGPAQGARPVRAPRSTRSSSPTRGEFLPTRARRGSTSAASALSERVIDARLDTAELALEAGDSTLAQQLGREVLEADPYREAAWRLMMRIAALLGDPDGVIREYKACERALADVGTTPAGSTRKLLEQLRALTSSGRRACPGGWTGSP